jgi:hypothetical protein
MAIKTLVITGPVGGTGATGYPLVVPTDLGSLISIEVISGGGGGSVGAAGHGGGGGGYAKITGCTGFVAGATMFYYIGYGGSGGSTGPATAGGPTWLNVGSNAMPTAGTSSGIAVTVGGGPGATGAPGASGGGYGAGAATGATGTFIGQGVIAYPGGRGA